MGYTSQGLTNNKQTWWILIGILYIYINICAHTMEYNGDIMTNGWLPLEKVDGFILIVFCFVYDIGNHFLLTKFWGNDRTYTLWSTHQHCVLPDHFRTFTIFGLYLHGLGRHTTVNLSKFHWILGCSCCCGQLP